MPNSRPRPDWDCYFLNICKAVAERSPDPRTQHGSVLVNDLHRIVGAGYNGSVRGGEDDFDWNTEEKYKMVVHAEANCILNACLPPVGATIYITGPPCLNCVLAIIQVGIKRVVFGAKKSIMNCETETGLVLLTKRNIPWTHLSQ